jgi:hypothetical protein
LHQILDLCRTCKPALATHDLPNARRDGTQQPYVRAAVALLGGAHQVAECNDWRAGSRHTAIQSTPRLTFFRRAPNVQTLVDKTGQRERRARRHESNLM